MDDSLIAQIKRQWIVSIWDFGTFESFIKFIRKDMRIIKCRKVKFGAYQGGQPVFISFDCPFCKLSYLCEPTSRKFLSYFLYILELDEVIEASHMAISEKVREKERKR